MSRYVRPLIAAVAVQPLVFLAIVVISSLGSGRDVPVGEALLVAGIVALAAVPVVILLGLPAFLVLRFLDKVSMASVGTAGFVAAVLACAVFAAWANEGEGARDPVRVATTLGYFGLYGAAGGIAAFSVWRAGDGSVPPPAAGLETAILAAGLLLLLGGSAVVFAQAEDWRVTSAVPSPTGSVVASVLQSRTETSLAPYGEAVVLTSRWNAFARIFSDPVYAGYCMGGLDVRWQSENDLVVSCPALDGEPERMKSRWSSVEITYRLDPR